VGSADQSVLDFVKIQYCFPGSKCCPKSKIKVNVLNRSENLGFAERVWI
jgi:hypothetical protein